MLNLHPPYLDVGNIRIYTDDTDPNTFYYVTQKPRIALGDNGKPAISIYAVVPESGVGKDNDSILETAMSIDVDLSVTDEEIDAVKKAIQSNFKQKAKMLSPTRYTKEPSISSWHNPATLPIPRNGLSARGLVLQ